MAAADVRSLLEQHELVYAPGAWDGLSARLIEEAGFEAVCSSGYAISASLGMPDVELYTATENVGAIARIREGCDLPLVADIDTGYGNAANVMRTVRAAEAAGASAFFMEDQLAPKRCPVCVGDPVEVIPIDEAAGKIAAAADAKHDRSILIARTDATGDDALERLEAYRDAGAELLMPVTKTFSSAEEWRACAARVETGLVATITAGTWTEREFTPELLRELGVRIALLPNQPVHIAAGAIRSALARLREGVPPSDVTAEGMAPKEFTDVLGLDDVLALHERYLPAEV